MDSLLGFDDAYTGIHAECTTNVVPDLIVKVIIGNKKPVFCTVMRMVLGECLRGIGLPGWDGLTRLGLGIAFGKTFFFVVALSAFVQIAQREVRCNDARTGHSIHAFHTITAP
ncbi:MULTISPECIES: hypothetical protein [Symbiopectobacterium]|uniref:hypothetical protein n=1 Tax=Symbiopectobacterium TaxID=801 RepID=UPI001A34D95F|nr:MULTISPECIES: hypothetical protein [Symbiopectobacterium]MBG6248047.1 hypothetical protein [Candidatus Symbiopectobacterium sp. PLON1]MBT9429432.1 hypothetical protein [Candidatus Symbiopectobacterium endolongispinus]